MSVEKDLINGTCEYRVKALLDKYPFLRDNDKKLYLSYLNSFHNLRDRIKSNPENSYETLKEIILNPDVPMFESVSRARRKVQEKFSNLRGLSYSKRKESAEVVKDWSVGKIL